MKTIKAFILIFVCSVCVSTHAQEQKQLDEKEDKQSYYEKRAHEDAKYEQQLKMENENEEAKFWNDQERYEKDLKKRDRKAYRAYMRGKRDAYAEHYDHCGHSCYHSDHYYHHAAFYYHDYHYYDRPRYSKTMRTTIRVGVPSVRIGF